MIIGIDSVEVLIPAFLRQLSCHNCHGCQLKLEFNVDKQQLLLLHQQLLLSTLNLLS